jgi:hypothetical protein
MSKIELQDYADAMQEYVTTVYDLIEKVEYEINGVTGKANAKGKVREVL